MACLSKKFEAKVKALADGVRTRRRIKQAQKEFEQAVGEIEGSDNQIFWSAHNVFFTVKSPTPPPSRRQQPIQPTEKAEASGSAKTPSKSARQLSPASKQIRLRELRLKREMYVSQLRIVEEKIKERERRKSPFHL